MEGVGGARRELPVVEMDADFVKEEELDAPPVLLEEPPPPETRWRGNCSFGGITEFGLELADGVPLSTAKISRSYELRL